MRRSDMILKIMEALVEAPEELEEAAEYILTHIEKAGMIPPYNPPHLDHGAVQDCQWDPEETVCEIPEYTFKCDNCTCEEE